MGKIQEPFKKWEPVNKDNQKPCFKCGTTNGERFEKGRLVGCIKCLSNFLR